MNCLKCGRKESCPYYWFVVRTNGEFENFICRYFYYFEVDEGEQLEIGQQ